MKGRLLAFALLAAAILSGCAETTPGRTMSLGAVDYNRAFETAKETLAQYSYSVAEANPDTGEIVSRPLWVEPVKDRLFGASPQRQIATLHLYRKDKNLTASLSIAVQRQASSFSQQMAPGEGSYSGVPNQTPAQTTGATTAEQNETWYPVGYDHRTEAAILADLHQKLRPMPATTTESARP